MKKIATLFISFIFCALSFACAAAPVAHTFDADKPWGGNNTQTATEICTYDITIRERVRSGKETTDGEILARGKAVYTLNQELESGKMYTTVELKHTVTFEDTEKAGFDRGLTDVVESKVRFTTDGLAPVYSYKKETYAPRKTADGKYQSYVYDYEAEADYDTLQATVKKNRNVNEDGTKETYVNENDEICERYNDVKEFSLLSGTQSFDNEELYHVARALTSTAPKGSESISISNLYEIPEKIDKKGKYKNINVTVSTAEDLSVITLNESFAKNYIAPAESGNYEVNCMRTSLMRNDTYSGPAFTLYMTAPGVKFERKNASGEAVATTNKIIVRMVRVTYDLSTREESSNIVYELSDYSTEK